MHRLPLGHGDHLLLNRLNSVIPPDFLRLIVERKHSVERSELDEVEAGTRDRGQERDPSLLSRPQDSPRQIAQLVHPVAEISHTCAVDVDQPPQVVVCQFIPHHREGA